MRNFLLGGVAVATILMIQSVPASSQGVYGAGHPRVSHSYAAHGPAHSRYQHLGYAHGQAGGYGVGAGVAAVAAGALIGGAIASQNQGYYPKATTPLRLIRCIRTQVTGIATPRPLCITTAIPWPTANRLTDHTIQAAGPTSAMTG